MDGLIIRHPQTGEVIFNPDTITTHIRAAFTTTGSSGSLQIPDLARGGGFIVQALPASEGTDFGSSVFQINGTTLTWTSASRPMRVVVATRAIGSGGGERPFDGYVCRRPSGVTQISSVDRALQLSNYGALTLTPGGPTTSLPMVYKSLTVSGTNPVLAWRATNGKAVSIHRVTVGSGQFTFHFACQSSDEVGIQWWTFDVSAQSVKLNTDAALILREPTDGTITFDSRSYALNLVDGGTSGEITPAPGQELAAIQATFGTYVNVYEDNELGGQAPYPGWKYTVNESYHAAAAFAQGGTVTYGLFRYEFWAGWVHPDEYTGQSYNGQTSFAFADITGLPREPMPNVNTITVNVSHLTREVTLSAAGPTTTVSPSVTASASGGSGQGYQYDWYFTQGSTDVVANTGTSSATFSTKVVNQQLGTIRSAKWWCRVSDSSGRVGWSAPVTFTHTLNAADLTPNTFTLPTMSVSSNEHDVSWDTLSYGTYTVSGIDAPITVRFERYDYSGNLTALHVDVYTKAPGGSWVHHGYYDAHASGARYIDVPNVINGTEVRYRPHAITSSGKRSGSCRFVLWSLQPNVQFASSASCSFTVDADDNYNIPDYRPNPMTFPTQSWSTANDSTSGAYSTNGPNISGINQPITLRFKVTSVTSNLSTGAWFITNIQGSTHTNLTSGTAMSLNSFVDVVVTNGTNLTFKMNASTASGIRSANGTITVYNMSDGEANLGSFNFSVTVDNDDNFNNADYVPNAVDWANISGSTDAVSFYSSNAARTISGINRTINIRATISNFSGSNVVNGSRLDIWVNGAKRGDSTNIANGSWTDANVNNNDTVYFIAHLGANNQTGAASASYTVTVTNITTGQVLDTFTVNQTANLIDYTPDALNLSTLSVSTNSEYGAASQSRTITGINRPITIRASVSSVSGNLSNGGLYVQKNGVTIGTYIYWLAGSGSREDSFVNGDTINFYADGSTTSGVRSGQFYTTLTNVTTGAIIDGFWTYITVDADNNYNVSPPPTVSVSPYSLDQWEYANQGEYVQVYVGRINLSISGGQGTVTQTWTKQSGLAGWEVYAGPGYADFYYYGRTNFQTSAVYRITVTDSLGRSHYQDVGMTASAGNIQN